MTIEHVSLRCSNPKKSRDFYEQALTPIGYEQDWKYGDAFAFKSRGHHDFWVTKGKVGTPLHIAFNCRRRSEVDAFYEAAMAAGGKDNGAPGLRSENGPNYYAAFVIDPDGHNVEAVSFEAKRRKPGKKVARARTKTANRSRRR